MWMILCLVRRWACKEDRELYLKDGTEKIFYNCAADPEKVPENLRELYDYIRSEKVGGDLSQRIDEAVCIARKNEEWMSEYMIAGGVIMCRKA